MVHLSQEKRREKRIFSLEHLQKNNFNAVLWTRTIHGGIDDRYLSFFLPVIHHLAQHFTHYITTHL
jgi:hypothetical protein